MNQVMFIKNMVLVLQKVNNMLSPLELEALKLSAYIAIIAVSFSLIPGIAIAWFLSKKFQYK